MHKESIEGNMLELATDVGERLRAHNYMLAAAESCTGGWIAQALTAIPGSSDWFDRGFVTYSNAAKQDMLDVDESTLEQNGAVSEAVALEMAVGALQRSAAQVSVAVTGIAGPGGGTEEKPVGLVWFAWAQDGKVPVAEYKIFAGDREAVRRQTVIYALKGLQDLI